MSKKTIQAFKKKLEEENKSIYTIIAYVKDIEQFVEFAKEKREKELANVNSTDIKAFVKDYQDKGYTIKSVSRKLNSIKTFFKFCVEQQVIKKNPTINVPHPKLEATLPRVLTEQEFMSLRDACRKDARLYSIVELLIQTGMKIGELCRLEMDDLIYENGELKYLHVKSFESSLERNIPLNKSALQCVETYLNIRPKTRRCQSLFVTKNGNPLLVRNIRFYLDAAFKKAGINDATVNDLRNTFIAHHLSKGTNILFISQVVGHKRVSTTEKYAKVLGLNRDKTVLEEL